MQSDRDLLRQALGYMESVGQMDMHPEEWAIAVALRERLAQHTTRIVTDVNGRKHITNEPRLRE